VQVSPPFALSGLITGGKTSLLITNVYLPPGVSSTELGKRWEMLEDHLLSCHTKCPNSPDIIGGDFNARTAANWEVLIKSKWWAPICLDNFDAGHAKMRISKDIKVNKAGATFYQMVIRLNLVLLNGSYPLDIPGEFTHLDSISNSVIDYVLISTDLSTKVFSFKVQNRQFSDYLPLVTRLSLNWSRESLNHPIPLETASVTKIKGIKWSKALAHKYQEFFHNGISTHSPLEVPDEHNPVMVLEHFNHLTTNLTAFFYITCPK
ncbi:hypothetical protein JRQ81_005164, partial [Phrynocephalus forsythii]